jgi:predicted NBD/HSP70 family sugar kinase
VNRDVTRRTTGSRPADVKIDNKRSVLQYVYLQGTSSKPGVCRAVGLSRPTGSNLIDELIESGVLRKTTLGAPSDTGGKRPQLFEFDDDAGWAIGIDADGQAVRGIAANLRLAALAVHAQPADASRPERADRAVAETARAVAETARVLADAARSAGRPVIGIGVSLPGVGSAAPVGRGVADRGTDAVGRLAGAVSEALGGLGLPVLMSPRIYNVAVAETWFGYGIAGHRAPFMVVDTHDGLSTGLVQASGETPANAAYSTAALGHTTVNLDGPRCWCGNRGCWELYGSERAFLEAVKRGATLWHLPSALAADLQAGNPPAVSEVASHLRKGDEFARTQVETYADRLAIGLVNVVNAFSLGVVVLHGGLRPLGQSFLDLVARHVRDVALPPAAAEFDIMFSALPDNAPLMAAAAVIRHAMEGTALIAAPGEKKGAR